MRTDIRTTAKTAGVGVAALAAAMFSASTAFADPAAPPAPPPPPDTVNQAAPTPPDGVPHLSSPENLPPGTSDDPVPGMDSPGKAYAREIWHAIQDHDISWRQGLVLLAQRPMNPNATPPPGLSAGPQEQGPQPNPALPPPSDPAAPPPAVPPPPVP